MTAKAIALLPEAAFGNALMSVGIARANRKRGHHPLFQSDSGFADTRGLNGFEARPVSLPEPTPPDQMAASWQDVINGHIPNS